MPASAPPSLIVVLDPDYSDRLESVIAHAPVWIVDTPSNKEACQRIWKRQPHSDHREIGAITSFGAGSEDNLSEGLFDVLPQLETHHGVVDGDYLRFAQSFVVEVIGVRATKDIVSRLAELGLDVISETPDGFRAKRRGD
jgi:hypothetical protein